MAKEEVVSRCALSWSSRSLESLPVRACTSMRMPLSATLHPWHRCMQLDVQYTNGQQSGDRAPISISSLLPACMLSCIWS